jgi:parvulin-like peptidyl-prolyl isomerase
MADDPLMTVRHILVSVARDTATADEIAKAKTDAEGILAEVKDEASFIALAKSKSADTGSAAEGGLIAGFAKGQMVPEFEDWAFASGRKAGDTGIVQSDYGFHVMYFVKSTPSYRYEIESTLRTDAMTAYMKEQQALDTFKLVTSQSAMNLY